jgi:hypothetical protein
MNSEENEVFSEEIDLSECGVCYVVECNGKEIASVGSLEELNTKISEYCSKECEKM